MSVLGPDGKPVRHAQAKQGEDAKAHYTRRDPLLVGVGVVKALRKIAEGCEGCTDVEDQLRWCLNTGLLKRSAADREILELTGSGSMMVYAFWGAYKEALAEVRDRKLEDVMEKVRTLRQEKGLS